MDPFELLKNDHAKVSELFERIEAASGQARIAIFKTIQSELELHTQIEEKIFYPALRNAEATRDLILEGYEEHQVVKDLLAELAAAKLSDQWNAKLTVLKENVEHHVDEEENELFGKAKDVLSTDEAEALGDRMAAEKKKAGVPVPEEVAKPGLIKTVVNAIFGSKTKTSKKKSGKKAVTKSLSTVAAKRTSKKSATSKKKAATKKVASKKAGKRLTTKASKKSANANRAVKKSVRRAQAA